NSRAVRRLNTSFECRGWGQLCKKAEHFTSIVVPSGATTSKLFHPIRSGRGSPTALATRNSASIPRVVFSRRSLQAQRQKSATVPSPRATGPLQSNRTAADGVSQPGPAPCSVTRAAYAEEQSSRRRPDSFLLAAEAEVHAERWRCIKIRPRRCLRRRGWDCLPREDLLITARRAADMVDSPA